MSVLRINKNGYYFLNNDSLTLYSENQEHNFLFKFISSDLTEFSTLLTNYISEIINTDTLEIISSVDLKSTSKIILKKLESIHPYFLYEGNKFIRAVIADYFNSILLKKTSEETSHSFPIIFTKEWYVDKLGVLLNPFLPDNYDINTELYNYYDNYTKASNKESTLKQSANNKYNTLSRIQDSTRRLIFWLLDASIPYLKTLDISQRLYLFRSIFFVYDEIPAIHLVKITSFKNPQEDSHIVKYITEQHDFISAYNLSFDELAKTHLEDSTTLETKLQNLKKAVEVIKNSAIDDVYEEYSIDYFFQLIFIEIYYMLQNKIMVKKCRHCNMYFVVTNLNVEYCNRIAEGETRPCSEIGSERAFKKKLEEDYPLNIYNKAYRTHHARMRNGKMSQDEFNVWFKEAKEKLNLVRENVLEIDTFEEWLKI